MLRWITWGLADRQPFAECAHRIFALAEIGELTLCVSALTFSNLYYILRKPKRHADTLALLNSLKLLVCICAVTGAEIEAALLSEFRDVEDAIQYFTAKAAGDISAIVTRNKGDYDASDIPILTPEEFLAKRAI